MMHRLLKACLSTIIFFALPLAAQAGGFEATAELSGDEEVPPVATDTGGKFEIEFDRPGAAEIELVVDEGTRITQAHLHCAPRGENGPVVAFLAGFHALGWDVDGEWVGNTSLSDANIIAGATPSATCPDTIETLDDLIAAIGNGNVYVNVHSVANPAGEVRGQLAED